MKFRSFLLSGLAVVFLWLPQSMTAQVDPPTDLHDSVPFQGHELLYDPVVTEFRDETKHRLDCDWPEMMRMVRDLEVKLGTALEEEVYREYRDRVQLEDRVFMSYNCYHLRDSIIALQIELDEALASEPTMETRSLEEIAQNVARLRGAVIDDGNVDLQAWAFRYGTDSTLSDSIFVPFGDYASFLDTSALDTGAFEIELSGLTRYTLYYYSAVGTNEEGAGYGDTLSFRTLPDLATGLDLDTLDVTSNSAKLILDIDDAGGQGPDSVGFFWGTSDFASMDLAMDSLPSDSAEGSVHGISLSGLTRYTDYYFNAYADNLAGRATAAANMAFKTLPELPSFDSIYFNVSADSLVATLSDDGGQAPTDYSMKYDVVANMDTAVTLTSSFANDEIRAYLSDLAPGENYYANASATNDAGTVHSDTGLFVTPPEVSTIVFGVSTWTKLSEDFTSSVASMTGKEMDLSADGQTLAIGIPSKNGNTGQVEVYSWTDEGWVAKGDPILGESSGEYFGEGVAISDDGNTLVAGAWQFKDGANDGAGKVNIYGWNEGSGTWELQGSPFLGAHAFATFGRRVAISGDGTVVAMGSQGHYETFGTWNLGRVQVVKWSGTAWEQMGADILGEVQNTQLGASIRLNQDGTTIIVGSSGLATATPPVHSDARVYEWNEVADAWETRGEPIEEVTEFDNTGSAVAISGDGNTIFVGSRYCDEIGDDQGRVRAFKWNEGSQAWEQLGENLDGEYPEQTFGTHISTTPNGLTVAVGSPLGSIAPNQAAQKGYIRVFDLVAESWQERSEYIAGDNSERYGLKFEITGNGQQVAVFRQGGANEGGIALWEWPVFTEDQYPKPTQLAFGGEAVYNSAAPTSLGFFYDTNASFTSPDTVFTTLGTGGEFESLVTGLSSGQRHYFKAFATNAGGTGEGTISNLATQLGIETDTAFVTYESVDFEGYADYEDVGPSSLWFVYGFAASLEDASQAIPDDIEPEFRANDVVIPAGTQVFFAALGENESGISSGDTLSVITQVKPIADYVTSPTDSTAVLNGHFEYAMDLGAPDSVGFEWSFNQYFGGPGGDTLVSAAALASDTSLSLELPFIYGQTYYYRAIAVNAGGRSEGEPLVFCAGACPDSVSYEGVDYGIVRIGCQCYFTENLQAQRYVNGDSIPAFAVETAAEQNIWSGLEIGGQILFDDSARAASGGFYNRTMVEMASQNASRKFCPPGWSVLNHNSPTNSWPNYIQLTDDDQIDSNAGFTALEKTNAVGRAVKATPLDVPGWDGNNGLGFSLLPFGIYNNSGGKLNEDESYLLTRFISEPLSTGNLLLTKDESTTGAPSFAVGLGPAAHLVGNAAANVRCEDDSTQHAPLVFGINAANATATSATIQGYIGFGGWKTTSVIHEVTEAGFIWSEHEDLSDSTWTSVAIPTSDSLFLNLTGLTENQTYWYQSYAVNVVDTSYSDVRSFVAAVPTVPIVETNASHSFYANKFFKLKHRWSATLLDKGNSEVQSAGWLWSRNADLSAGDDTTQIAGYHSEIEDLVLNNDTVWELQKGLESSKILHDDLLLGANYHYAAYATNGIGTGWGDTLSVYTPIGVQPGVTNTHDHSMDISGLLKFEEDSPDTVAFVWSTSSELEPLYEDIITYTSDFQNSFDTYCQDYGQEFFGPDFQCSSIEDMDADSLESFAWVLQNFAGIHTYDIEKATYLYDVLAQPADTVVLTLNDDKTFEGLIEFPDSIEVGAEIHYQVFASNAHGSFYSPINFITTGECASIEFAGHTYATEKFQDDCWFTENLRTEVLANGDSIPFADLTNASGSYTNAWGDYIEDSEIAQSFVDSTTLAQYGRLYNMYTSHPDVAVCPVGTHIAEGNDWVDLAKSLNKATSTSTDLNPESIALSYLLHPSEGGTNISGFSAGGSTYEVNYSGVPTFPQGHKVTSWWRKASKNSDGDLAGASFAMLDTLKGLSTNNTVNMTLLQPRDARYIRCVVDDPLQGPEVVTGEATDVSQTGLMLNGQFEFEGWREITSKGFKWGYEADLSDATILYADSTLGEFTAALTGLDSDAPVHYAAFAIDALGREAMGDTLTTCLMNCPSVTFDGHTYDTRVIGCNCWFAENLRTTTYADGSAIAGGLNDANWAAATTGAQVVYNNDAATYLEDYGRLYNLLAVQDSLGLCPSGWHVSTDQDFNALVNRYGGQATAGDELKASPSQVPGWNGTNFSGFSMLPGGMRGVDGTFEDEGGNGFIFLVGESDAMSRRFSFDTDEIENSGTYQKIGYSVRCVRDSSAAPSVVTAFSLKTDSTLRMRGIIEDSNWASISSSGFKWGLQEDLSDGIEIFIDSLDGSFRHTLTGLSDGDMIYYTAFATNSEGTAHGDTLSVEIFSCESPTMDGHTYDVVAIGNHCWFAENLSTRVYANDSIIPTGLDQWSYQGDQVGSQSVYNDDESNAPVYGRLYNGGAVTDSAGLCPTNWHVPSEEEFLSLSSLAYGLLAEELKSVETWGGTDEFGYNLLPAGIRAHMNVTPNYSNLGTATTLYTSTETGTVHPTNGAKFLRYYQFMLEPIPLVQEGANPLAQGGFFSGSSIRCVMDTVAPALSAIQTSPVEWISVSGGELRGEIVSDGLADGLASIDSTWFVYSLHSDLSDSTVIAGDATTGAFKFTIDGIPSGTEVFYSARAANAAGISSGDTLSFTTATCEAPTFGGYTYDVVGLNHKCWFAENLRSDHYADGTPIPTAEGAEYTALTNAEVGLQVIYDHDSLSYFEDHGRLYNWFAVKHPSGLCPTGWHVPSENEFYDLVVSLGYGKFNGAFAEGAFKSSPTDSPGWDGTNSTGMSGLPSGQIERNGAFTNGPDVTTESNRKGWHWSSTPHASSAWSGYAREMQGTSDRYSRSSMQKYRGLSVRCVTDE